MEFSCRANGEYRVVNRIFGYSELAKKWVFKTFNNQAPSLSGNNSGFRIILLQTQHYAYNHGVIFLVLLSHTICRCRVGVHWLWSQPTLVVIFVHRFWHPFSCHVDYQRVPLLRNDLFMCPNRFHRKRAFHHWRIWPVHPVVAGFAVRFQVILYYCSSELRGLCWMKL